jgi:hypothetical protein
VARLRQFASKHVADVQMISGHDIYSYEKFKD